MTENNIGKLWINAWNQLNKIPLQFRIKETCFMPIAVIRRKHYSNNLRNTNCVLKDIEHLVSVIITMVKYIIGSDTVIYDRL